MKKPPRSLRQIIRDTLWRRAGFARDEQGATAVEFALLGLPFFALIAAILETAMVFFASQVLDSAVQDSSRLVRTGQTQIEEYTPEMYKEAVCSRLFGLFDCTQLKLRVTELVNFTTAEITEEIFDPDTGEWIIEEDFDQGVGSSIILIEAYYKWPTFIDFMGIDFSDSPDGTRLLAAVQVFRNEPFS